VRFPPAGTSLAVSAVRRIGELINDLREAGKMAKNKPGPGRGKKGVKAGEKISQLLISQKEARA
jgi:hypothetical protein